MTNNTKMRQADCLSCNRSVEVPEDPNRLAFFEFCGEGSDWATSICTCNKHKRIHAEINPTTGREGITDHEFQPRGPRAADFYYCGCRGWD